MARNRSTIVVSAWRLASVLAGAIVGALVVAAVLPSRAAAQEVPSATVLVFDGLPSPAAGEQFTLAMRLTTASGAAIIDQGINVDVAGERHRARTDANGRAELRVRQELTAGSYQVVASFGGATRIPLAPAAVSTVVTVRPISVRVETVPPVAGVRMRFDATDLVTDGDGVAEFSVDSPGVYALNVLEGDAIDENTRWAFRRWESGGTELRREIVVPEQPIVQLGLEIQRRISFRYFDLRGEPVPSDSIGEVTLKSSVGDIVALAPNESIWIRDNNVTRGASGLSPSPVVYSVSAVLMSGANVVTQGQQKISSQGDGTTTRDIELLLYDLRLRVRDRIFGWPMGTAVDLQYPDGRVERFSMAESGIAEVPGLPRGEYLVTVISSGLRLTQPISLTRPQDLVIKVVSYADVALAFLTLGIVGFGPLVIGKQLRVVRFLAVPVLLLWRSTVVRQRASERARRR